MRILYAGKRHLLLLLLPIMLLLSPSAWRSLQLPGYRNRSAERLYDHSMVD